MENHRWFYVAAGRLIASIVTLFLPIITYVEGDIIFTINIVDLVAFNPNIDHVLAAG